MNRQVLLCVLALLAGVAWAGGSVDPDYYRSTVFPKDSGVYEQEGVLYVQSVALLAPGRAKTAAVKLAAQRDALLGVDALLKAWAISNTAPLRVKMRPSPAGLAVAQAILEACRPSWQFAEWKLDSLPTRLLNNALEGERHVAAFGIEKEALVAALPPTFKRPCSEAEVLAALPRFLGPRLAGNSSAKVLGICGVCDRIGTEGVEAAVADAFARVNEKVATVSREPRFQLLLLDPEAGTNAPFARLASGTRAIAAVYDKACTTEAQAELLRSALEENPGDKELWNYYGRVLAKQGETAAAIVCYRNALKLDATFVYPQVNLANAYHTLGFDRLAWGLAVAVYSVPTDAWSHNEAERLLLGGRLGPRPVGR